MDLDEVEERHTRAQRVDATTEDRERSLSDIPKLVAMVRRLRGEGPPTHDSGVRELFRAREVGTGRLKVVFTDDTDSRPQIADARYFDSTWISVAPDKTFSVVGKEGRDLNPSPVDWQCRRCRQIMPANEERHAVMDDNGAYVGPWCSSCLP